VECYGLNMRCPPQVHVLNAWSPAGGAILEGSGNFRRGCLAKGSRSLGHILGAISCLGLLLNSFSVLLGHHEVKKVL
jgi:hypothetical protein